MSVENELLSLVLICHRSTCDIAAGKAWFSYAADVHATWPPACLQSWLKFNFADKRQCMFSFVREVSHEVPAATSQIHRRHMRTTLNDCDTSPTCEDITPPATRNIAGLYRRHACEVELESQACRRWRLTWPLLPETSILISERCRRQHRQLCRG